MAWKGRDAAKPSTAEPGTECCQLLAPRLGPMLFLCTSTQSPVIADLLHPEPVERAADSPGEWSRSFALEI